MWFVSVRDVKEELMDLRSRAAAVEQKNIELNQKNRQLRQNNSELQDRNQWLLLQLGIMGFEVVTVPGTAEKVIPARVIPAVPPRIEVRKVKGR